MTDTPTQAAAATPREKPETETPQLKAAKDKNCPFCGQAFTSSSLGRHLDLYVRQKNPKPPDGVHIVEEIKKIRGGITRRQVKSGSRKESNGTPMGSKQQSVIGDGSPVIVQSPTEDEDSIISAKPRQRFNDIAWQPNGPSRALGVKTPEVRRDVSRQMQKADLEQRHKLSEDAETAKATEMALRELLKSVREAKYVQEGALWINDSYITVRKCLARACSTSIPTRSTSQAYASISCLRPPRSSRRHRSQLASLGRLPLLVRSSSRLSMCECVSG